MGPTKRSKIIGNDEDCISNLPEDLLTNILSRLPTTDVVRTSILSKDWENRWTSSYNLDLSNVPTTELYNKMGMFVAFVDRILHFSRHLKSFHLKGVTPCELSDVQRWISTALRHDLVTLELNDIDEGLIFPCSLLNSVSLRKLDLYLQCTLYVASKNFAPNLTSLYLTMVDISMMNGNKNTNTVAFTFPVLETLSLTVCNWLDVKCVEIYAPSLTTFVSEPFERLEEYEYSVVIHAPMLNKFECCRGLPEKFTLNDGSSSSLVTCAAFECEGEFFDTELIKDIRLRSLKLLNAFTSLEELVISSYLAEVCRLGPPLHRHDKLRRLTLPSLGNLDQLFYILDAAPTLQYLSIYLKTDFPDYDYGAKNSVPSCIVSHLEEVEFGYFLFEMYEYELVEFLLEKSEKLKKLLIRCGLPPKMHGEVKEYLSALPRHSPFLSINVV